MLVAECVLWRILWGMQEMVTPRRAVLIIFRSPFNIMNRILFFSHSWSGSGLWFWWSLFLFFFKWQKKSCWYVKTPLWAVGYVLWVVVQMDSFWSLSLSFFFSCLVPPTFISTTSSFSFFDDNIYYIVSNRPGLLWAFMTWVQTV